MQSVNLISDARFTDDKPNTLHAIKTDQLLVEGVYLKPGQRTGWRKIAGERRDPSGGWRDSRGSARSTTAWGKKPRRRPVSGRRL